MNKPILYHTNTCPQCKVIELMLNKERIEFESIMDINTAMDKGIEHTPALEIDEKILYGKDIINWIKSQKEGV